MRMESGSLDSWTKSTPLRSTSNLRVRKVTAGFASFSRNHAEQAFSLCRISRTLSRARRIFCPRFPLVARSSCTRSLGGSHPVCARLEGLHGFTEGALTAGKSAQDELASLAVGAPANRTAPVFSKFVIHAAGRADELPGGRGSAGCPMNLRPCGNADVPAKFDTKISATARMLRWAEYIFSPARTCNPPQTVLRGSLPDGRQPEAARETVKPRSGAKKKDEGRGAKPPQLILECVLVAYGISDSKLRSSHQLEPQEVTSLNLENLVPGSRFQTLTESPGKKGSRYLNLIEVG